MTDTIMEWVLYISLALVIHIRYLYFQSQCDLDKSSGHSNWIF